MTSSVVSPQPAASPAAKPWRPSRLTRLFAFTPLWVLLLAPLAFPVISHPTTLFPPTFADLLPGALAEGLVLLWMLIGVFVLWNARSLVVVAFVYALFTIPATLGVVVAPAVALILQNVG